jgi:hypothetical protein
VSAKKKKRRNWRKDHLEGLDRHVEAMNSSLLRIADLEKELKADRAEAYYWRMEAETLRNDLVSQLRESAKTKPWPGDES